MSTEFRTKSTDELAFVRYCGKVDGQRQRRFEFGTISNWEACQRASRQGEWFVPLGEGGTVTDPDWFHTVVVDGRASFGEFPVTVELGSGEMFRFGVEE